MDHLVRKAALGLALLLAVTLAACSPSSSPAPETSTPDDTNTAAAIETLKPGVITAFTMSDGAPFASIKDGDWVGYEVELLRRIAGNLNLNIEFTARDFDSLLPTVAANQADIAFVSIADTDKRRETVDFTLPTYTGTNNLVVKTDSPIADGPQQVGEKVGADITGKRVGVLQASMGLQYAENYFTDAELVTFPNNNASIMALNSGSVDSVLLDGQSAYLFEDQFDVRTAFTTIDPDNRGAAIVISKDRGALREAMNAQLRSLLADGTMKSLLEEYNPKEPAEPVIKFLEDYYSRFPSDSYPH